MSINNKLAHSINRGWSVIRVEETVRELEFKDY